MKRSNVTFACTLALSGFAIGCTPVVPRELADARAAYQHASNSRASDLKPADLHQAKEALDKAEASFSGDPDSNQTRDLSYVAQRKAQLSEVLAGIELSSRETTQAGQSITNSEHAIEKRTEGELAVTRDRLAKSDQGRVEADQRTADANGRTADANTRAADADARAKAAQDALAKLAMVKDEARGMVITLSGSVLFASDQATLLPEAQTKLSQVADALLTTKERNVIVEGHTDSRGSAAHNMDLSQRRAEAVRNYIVSRGYEADKMQAHGIGMERPTTSNASAEGRANNRRVEIIVQPAKN